MRNSDNVLTRVSENLDNTMKSSHYDNLSPRSRARVEALPFPDRGAPKTLLSVMLATLMLAALASQVLPGLRVA